MVLRGRYLERATGVRALRASFLKHVSTSSSVGRDGMKPSALEADWPETARILQAQLRGGTYRFSPYRQVLLLKGAGKPPRELSIPNARDRVALRALLDALVASSGHKGRELPQAMASRFVKSWSQDPTREYVRIDLKAYYDSIDHTFLESNLKRKVRSPRLRLLTMAAVRTPSAPAGAERPKSPNGLGVPQGMALSNFLGDIFLESFDREFGVRTDIDLFRYVDDVIALCPPGTSRDLFDEMASYLQAQKLEVHEPIPGAKSSLGRVTEEFEFLGYRFHDQKVGVRKSSVRRLEDSLIRAIIEYQYQLGRKPREITHDDWIRACERRLEWHLGLLVTGCVFEESRRGWLPYFLCISDLSELIRLDRVLSTMVRRRKVPSTVKTRSFVKAFFAWKAPSNSKKRTYIPTFDGITVARKRILLKDDMGVPGLVVNDWSNAEVETQFARRLGRIVRRMERDIGSTS